MTKPFKIGIWVDEHIYPQLGGANSYTEKLINQIDNHMFAPPLEITYVGFNISSKLKKPLLSIPFKENLFEKKKNSILHKLLGVKRERKDIESNFKNAIELLKVNDIQLLFYLTPQVHIDNFPYIITNWDLAHKSTYAFPEFSMNGQFNNRDKYFSKILNQALFICCESQQGQLEIEQAYGISSKKIKILPMFAGSIVEAHVKEEKPDWLPQKTNFFLYPGQFWPHKNHYNLIIGFKDFLTSVTHNDFKLILTGSDKGNLPYIKALIKELNLEKEVIIAGFVDNPVLKWLYKNAKALIFPSFLGPTNMPLLEAKHLGCNIACSNLLGHQNLLGEGAIYFEPTNRREIKEAMLNLANKDKPEKADSTANTKNGVDILEQIFLDSVAIRRTWGRFDNIV